MHERSRPIGYAHPARYGHGLKAPTGFVEHPPGYDCLGEAVRTNLLIDAPIDDVRTVFETNVFGVIAVTQAMLPLL